MSRLRLAGLQMRWLWRLRRLLPTLGTLPLVLGVATFAEVVHKAGSASRFSKKGPKLSKAMRAWAQGKIIARGRSPRETRRFS